MGCIVCIEPIHAAFLSFGYVTAPMSKFVSTHLRFVIAHVWENKAMEEEIRRSARRVRRSEWIDNNENAILGSYLMNVDRHLVLNIRPAAEGRQTLVSNYSVTVIGDMSKSPISVLSIDVSPSEITVRPRWF